MNPWWPTPTRTLRSAGDDSWCHLFESMAGYADVEVFDDGDIIAGITPLFAEPMVREIRSQADIACALEWIDAMSGGTP